MDKKIKKIAKETKNVSKDIKSISREDHKRDKTCEYGKRMMEKKK